MVLKYQLRWKRLNAQITQRIYLKSTQENAEPKTVGQKKMRNQRFRIYIQMSSYSQIFITLFLRFSRFPNL